jgi:hypothetical protein
VPVSSHGLSSRSSTARSAPATSTTFVRFDFPTTSATDDAAFAAHSASEVHAADSPVFTELIAAADVLIGETLIATGWAASQLPRDHLPDKHQSCRSPGYAPPPMAPQLST